MNETANERINEIIALNVFECLQLVSVTTPTIINQQLDLSWLEISTTSLIDIITHLEDRSGLSTYVLTLGTGNLSRLTSEQKAIATNKNWTLV